MLPQQFQKKHNALLRWSWDDFGTQEYHLKRIGQDSSQLKILKLSFSPCSLGFSSSEVGGQISMVTVPWGSIATFLYSRIMNISTVLAKNEFPGGNFLNLHTVYESFWQRVITLKGKGHLLKHIKILVLTGAESSQEHPVSIVIIMFQTVASSAIDIPSIMRWENPQKWSGFPLWSYTIQRYQMQPKVQPTHRYLWLPFVWPT